MIVIAQGHKTEGLKTRSCKLSLRLEHLRHRVDWTRPAVKSDFYKIARREFMLHLQQAAGNGNRLKFRARTLPAFGMNGSRNGSIELYSGCTPGGVGLGEVGHSLMDYAIKDVSWADYQSTCPQAYPCVQREDFGARALFAIMTAVTFWRSAGRVLVCCADNN